MTITLTREEAQQVLDALTRIRWAAGERDKKNRVRDFDDAMDVSLASIETLRSRLSAPEPEQTRSEKMREAGITRRPKGWSKEDEPEPVAGYRWEEGRTPPSVTYTAPPQREWQGLTDEEIMSLLPGAVRLPPGWADTVRAIEQALKEKNT